MLTGSQYRRLTQALLVVFDTYESLEQVVRFSLSQNLAAIAGGSNLQSVIFNLIRWAEARGLVGDLIVAARNERPRDTALRAIAEELRLASAEPETGAYERIVLRSVKFQDVELWRERMSMCELPVCRIDVPGGIVGTGFLVGPSVVITNYHVIEQARGAESVRNLVALRFDRKRAVGGNMEDEGQRYTLSREVDWLLDHSPKSELDYALLRVQGMPGADPVGGQPGAPARSWLTPRAHTFVVGEPLVILQHPDGAPMKLAIGTVTEVRENQQRVVYSTNTGGGSSGAPCFTSDWGCVALHHYGQDTGNLGVMFTAILERLENNGVSRWLEALPAA
jgi:hypothetical protein